MRLSEPTDVPLPEPGNHQSAGAKIVGNGEMARMVRTYDWASTSLGPIEKWSRELVAIVNLTLYSHHPAETLWGPDLVLIYNDSYRSIPGRRPPDALGKPAREVYKEAWSVIGPMLEKASTTGETSHFDKLRVPIETDSGVRDMYLDLFDPVGVDVGKLRKIHGAIRGRCVVDQDSRTCIPIRINVS